MSPTSGKGFLSGLTTPLRIKSLWNQLDHLKINKESDTQAGIAKCTELLGLLSNDSQTPDKGEVLCKRADLYAYLRQSDPQIDDLAEAVAFSRQKKDAHQVELREKHMRIAVNFKKFASFKPGDPKRDIWYSLPTPANMWDFKAYSRDRLFALFAYLGDPEPDIRARANELIASLPFGHEPRLTEWVIDFYRDHLEGAERFTGLRALRQLGRMTHMELTDTVPFEISLVSFGVASAFVCCTCAFCGWPNTGIPVPPRGPMIPYYSQKKDQGAYAVPAICDRCGNEFYLVWDTPPE